MGDGVEGDVWLISELSLARPETETEDFISLCLLDKVNEVVLILEKKIHIFMQLNSFWRL